MIKRKGIIMKAKTTTGHRSLLLLSPLALAVSSVISYAHAEDAEQVKKPEVITVTGSRIQRTELVSSSPVVSVDEAQIHLDRAVNVEDITAKLPQAAAGANSTGATVGDSLAHQPLIYVALAKTAHWC